jgi:hypothetical protein
MALRRVRSALGPRYVTQEQKPWTHATLQHQTRHGEVGRKEASFKRSIPLEGVAPQGHKEPLWKRHKGLVPFLATLARQAARLPVARRSHDSCDMKQEPRNSAKPPLGLGRPFP